MTTTNERNETKTYMLSSTKGSRTVRGTLADAIAAAQEMDAWLQPMYGVDVWRSDGEKVASVDGATVEVLS